MPPMIGQNSIKSLSSKSINIKKTIRELSLYYHNYKKLFFVAIFLSLIGGVAATSAILLNGYVYSKFIIPSAIIYASQTTSSPIPYSVFGLISFVWFCIGLLITYLISNAFN
jgi:hypothetical protein